MKQNVKEAIAEIAEVYGENNLEITETGDGGANVIVKNIELGDNFSPSSIWCGFSINHMYPNSDVYPHFINSDFKLPKDTDPKGLPIQYNKNWNNKSCIQISRRSKRWNPANDTALFKLQKVINYIKQL